MFAALLQRNLALCLVIGLLVTTAVPTTVGETDRVATTQTASFASDAEHVSRGDVASIRVSLPDDEAVAISITGDGDYSARVTLQNRDGDGNATVRLNTYDGTFSVSDGDVVTVRSASDEAPLTVGRYEVVLCSHEEWDCDEVATDAMRMVVAERSTDALRTWVASSSANLSNLSAIETARTSGNLTQSHRVLRNASLVLELRASGLDGALAAQQGPNATVRFFTLLEDGPAAVEVVQRNPGASFHEKKIHLASLSSTRVVAGNGTYYLVVELADANVTRIHDDDPDNEVRPGEKYRVTFSFAAGENDGESVSTNFTVEEPAAVISGGDEPAEETVVVVANAPNQTVSGETNLPPGTELTVELRGQGADYRRASTVRVVNHTTSANRFAATFDFGDVPPGTNFTVDVRVDGRSLLESWDTAYVVVAENATETTTRRSTTAQTTGRRDPTTDHETKTDGTASDATEAETVTAQTPTPETGVPGFGVGVALAGLVALVGGALLARKS